MIRHLVTAGLAVLLGAAGAAPAAAQATIFLVRHAERADAGGAAAGMMADDPDLSKAGQARAESLAAVLKDAGVTTIYTTEFKRTKQTAAPLAKALGIQAVEISSKDADGLTRKLKAATGNVLVVGHSNTVPAVLGTLGVTETVTIGDQEFDNLFVVVSGARPTLVRLRFK